MLLAASRPFTHPIFCQDMIVRAAFCITLPFQIVVQPQNLSSDFSAFSTKTAVVKASFMPLFACCFSLLKHFLGSFVHCIFLQWTCCLLHFALRFAAFYLAFWCILHCVLVHFTLRFGAKWSVFCRILPYVLVHFTPYFAAKGVVWRTECIFKQR